MSKLLIQEPPLQVLPTLATAIGLNEAIILQQIQYWMNSKNTGKMHDGKKWIYNSVANWQKDNFPFWSIQTIKRALTSLKNQELVLTANLNKAAYDRTLWYTINYDQLKLVDQSISTECTNPLGQNGPMDSIKMDQPIPETTQETTTDNNIIEKPSQSFQSLTGFFPPHDSTDQYKDKWLAPLMAIMNQSKDEAEAVARIEYAVNASRASEKKYPISSPKSIMTWALNYQPVQKMVANNDGSVNI